MARTEITKGGISTGKKLPILCRRAEDTLERMRWEKKKRDYKIKREEINANDAIA